MDGTPYVYIQIPFVMRLTVQGYQPKGRVFFRYSNLERPAEVTSAERLRRWLRTENAKNTTKNKISYDDTATRLMIVVVVMVNVIVMYDARTLEVGVYSFSW